MKKKISNYVQKDDRNSRNIPPCAFPWWRRVSGRGHSTHWAFLVSSCCPGSGCSYSCSFSYYSSSLHFCCLPFSPGKMQIDSYKMSMCILILKSYIKRKFTSTQLSTRMEQTGRIQGRSEAGLAIRRVLHIHHLLTHAAV